jgi:hypothetical protein
MRKITIMKMYYTEETIEVADDATMNEIWNRVPDAANGTPVFDETVYLTEGDEEIGSI